MPDVGQIYVGEPPSLLCSHHIEPHAKVIEDMVGGFDYCEREGSLDFLGACETVCALEDSPEKATALAQLAGYALWYANNLRLEGM